MSYIGKNKSKTFFIQKLMNGNTKPSGKNQSYMMFFDPFDFLMHTKMSIVFIQKPQVSLNLRSP